MWFTFCARQLVRTAFLLEVLTLIVRFSRNNDRTTCMLFCVCLFVLSVQLFPCLVEVCERFFCLFVSVCVWVCMFRLVCVCGCERCDGVLSESAVPGNLFLWYAWFYLIDCRSPIRYRFLTISHGFQI